MSKVLTSMGQYLASRLLKQLTGWYVSPAVVYYLRNFVLNMRYIEMKKLVIRLKPFSKPEQVYLKKLEESRRFLSFNNLESKIKGYVMEQNEELGKN